MRAHVLPLLSLLLSSPALAWTPEAQVAAAPVSPFAPIAQVAPQPPKPPDGDPLAGKLYPPEMIMGRQKELGIDDKQRAQLIGEVTRFQAKAMEIQWQMQAAAEELSTLLEQAPVDETKAIAQAEKVMGYEREMKKANLGMLIRIKNLLTDKQRAQLASLPR